MTTRRWKNTPQVREQVGRFGFPRAGRNSVPQITQDRNCGRGRLRWQSWLHSRICGVFARKGLPQVAHIFSIAVLSRIPFAAVYAKG